MAVSAEDIQVRLKNLGYYGGKIDKDIGPATRQAVMDALDALVALRSPAKPPVIEPGILRPEPFPTIKATRLIPQDWLQSGAFQRVINHWTVGSHTPSEYDKDHYHILISGTGGLVKGNCDIAANSSTSPRGKKAWHTLNASGGSIGVSLAGMAGAQERPFTSGSHPITKKQFEVSAQVAAELCHRYKIPVTPKNTLSHAEVEANLAIKQRGKWDIAILPWDRSYDTARECGDLWRSMIQQHLGKL